MESYWVYLMLLTSRIKCGICTTQYEDCRTVILSNTIRHPGYEGHYKMITGNNNDPPRYKSDISNYIFANSTLTWCIGYILDDCSSAVIISDEVSSRPTAVGSWFELMNQEWMYSGINLACLSGEDNGSSGDTIVPWILVGILSFLLVLVTCGLLHYYKQQQSKENENATPDDTPPSYEFARPESAVCASNSPYPNPASDNRMDKTQRPMVPNALEYFDHHREENHNNQQRNVPLMPPNQGQVVLYDPSAVLQVNQLQRNTNYDKGHWNQHEGQGNMNDGQRGALRGIYDNPKSEPTHHENQYPCQGYPNTSGGGRPIAPQRQSKS